MNTCAQKYIKPLFGLVSASVLFIGLLVAESFVNLGHAAEQPTLAAPTQVAWYWGHRYPRGYYPRDYYERHYWSGWHRGPYGCQQRCFHNRYNGAVVRCERICY